MTPETLYARTTDDVWIAYQVFGDAPRDLVLVNAWVSHLEIMWEQPLFRSMLEALSQDARVITFEQTGYRSIRPDQPGAGSRSPHGRYPRRHGRSRQCPSDVVRVGRWGGAGGFVRSHVPGTVSWSPAVRR
jgi:pimeloyl-ACP methyl ester carboxylesterase